MWITRDEFKDISNKGVWKQNPSLVQLLGLCPLLAITTNMVNGVMLSLATLLVMTLANFAVSTLRHFIPYEIRIPVFILIAAALVTVVDLLMNAYLHGLYVVLGIFIPLIITNCIVLARIEAFAAKNPPVGAATDGMMMGIGLVWTLALLGAIREVVGNGTLFSGIDLVIPGAQALQLMPADYPGLLLAILPPGAFIALGCLIAAKNWIDTRQAVRAQRDATPLSVGGCH